MSELLNTKQAANYLNLKRNTLEVWRTKGDGPRYCKFGRAVRYRKEDLDDFAMQNVFRSTSEYGVKA